MKSASLFGVVAILSLAGSSFAQAPHAAAAPAPHVSAAPHSRPAPTAHPGSVHATSTTAAHSSSAPIRPFDVYGVGNTYYTPVYPVSPGGFVNPLGGTNHRGQRNNGSGVILFGAGYGYGYPYDYSGDDSQSQDQQSAQGDQQQSGGQQQPQYIFVQQVPGPGGANQAQFQNQQGPAPDASLTPREPEPPMPDVGSFTLVTRYGVELDAIAFTRSSDQIVYITPEGGRRTLAFNDLDVDKTQRLNAERGTPLTIPSADDATPPAKPKTKPPSEITN